LLRRIYSGDALYGIIIPFEVYYISSLVINRQKYMLERFPANTSFYSLNDLGKKIPARLVIFKKILIGKAPGGQLPE
jgi:hypothetical protein